MVADCLSYVLIKFLNLKLSNKAKFIVCTANFPHYFLSENVIDVIFPLPVDISKSRVWEAWPWWEIQRPLETNHA